MKNSLIVISIMLSCFLKGQSIIIEEEFNGGTTAPAGWIFTSITGTMNSASRYGKSQPSVVMDANGDAITSSTFVAGSANSLSFWAQSTSGTPTTSDIITAEYFDGSWNNCTPATFTFNTTARVFGATFPTTATRVRLTYTKSTVNVGVDDFTILNNTGTCTTSGFLWFTSIVYNSCDATCEGTDEFLSFQNGNSSLSLADLEITVPATGLGQEGTTFCGNSATPCDEYFTTNATYVSALNTVTGCTGFFLSPSGGVIPANGRVIIFMGNPPSSTINFGTLCGSGGNYYCVFASNSGTTNCQGRYSNNTNALRYTTIRNRSTGCFVERSFNSSLGINTDGDLVAFDPAGTPSYFSNPGCTGFAVLPIELVSFTGKALEGQISLTWQVAEEINNKGYIVEKSEDGTNWKQISFIESNPERHYNLTYAAADEKPIHGVNYYRLKDMDNEGKQSVHPVISVMYSGKKSNWLVSQDDDEIIISGESLLQGQCFNLYDLSGRIIKTLRPDENKRASFSKSDIEKGLFLLGNKEAAGGLIKLMIY